MRTSASPISSVSQATASLSFRSTVIDRLLALTARNPGDTPFQNGGPPRLGGSPFGPRSLMKLATKGGGISQEEGPVGVLAFLTTGRPPRVNVSAIARLACVVPS